MMITFLVELVAIADPKVRYFLKMFQGIDKDKVKIAVTKFVDICKADEKMSRGEYEISVREIKHYFIREIK